LSKSRLVGSLSGINHTIQQPFGSFLSNLAELGKLWNLVKFGHYGHFKVLMNKTLFGSKRGSENDDSRSNKSSKIESSRRVGGSEMLMEKLDVMVWVFIERSIKYMELMNLEAHTLVDSSHTLVDSLAKLVSLPSSISTTPEFCFACTLIEDPQKRTILNGLQDDDARLYWIKYLNDREK
ncbi:hypothetical protein Gotur_023880, partial [Gossypium turneri]